MKSNLTGKCYICPTPIGNLKDITLRALETLGQVDLIACEDTRRTLKLLNAYQIKKSLLLLNEHNKAEAQEKIITLLKDGKSIAVVSDAGMPGIADTGSELISMCIDENIHVEVLPGASAIVNALVASGFSCQQFLFVNFLPRKAGKITELLNRIRKEGYTACAYESPHRLNATLELFKEYDPLMEVCVCREMTKLHEEIIRGNIETVYNYYIHKKVIGEITLVIRWKDKGGINQ